MLEIDTAVSTTSADWLAGCCMQGQSDAECSSSMSDIETRIVMNLQVSWVAEGAAASGFGGGGRLLNACGGELLAALQPAAGTLKVLKTESRQDQVR